MSRPTRRDQVKSDEEYQMILWLNDAVKFGFVADWQYEPNQLLLFSKQTYSETVRLKTKSKAVQRHLHSEAVYTPDFSISLTEAGKSAFYHVFKPCLLTGNTNTVWVDIKGSFNPHDQPRYFSVIQKAVYDKHRVWVIRITPFYAKGKGDDRKHKGLFVDTFAPESERWMSGRTNPTLNKCGESCINASKFAELYKRTAAQQELI